MTGKKTYIVLVFVMLSLLAGCQEQGNDKTEGENKKEEYYYEYQGEKIIPGQKVEQVLEILGDDYEYFEAKSCAVDGMDMFYYYQNITLVVNEIEGEKVVVGLYFKNDTVATEKGIRINSTYEEVAQAYGSDYERNGTELEYSSENTVLAIGMEDGAVASIEYRLK
ncbi:MAG: hypothetical protein SPF70_08635 [Lachnospiraceae bacterium]|nr:hypothetical protein [Lachnospiraceae bacterium]